VLFFAGSGRLEMKDGDDTWAHIVGQSNELFSFFFPLTRSRVENRPGLYSLECQFPGFKIQGLI
jgi:hypothetical protein